MSQDNSITAMYYAPLDVNEYADYVRRTVEHYQNKIGFFDVWNEPWHPGFFSIGVTTTRPANLDRAAAIAGGLGWYLNSETAPEDFMKLQKAAYDTVKKINPNLKISGLNSQGGSGKDGRYDGDEWSRRMVAAGALKALDVAGYHEYTGKALGFRGDAVTEGHDRAIKPLGDAKVDIWLTEGSPVARATTSGFYNHTLPYKDGENVWLSADRIVRFEVRLLSENVKRMFLYSMDAAATFGQGRRARLMVNEDGYPHPMGASQSALAWNLEDTKFRSFMDLAASKSGAAVFDGAETSVIVLMPGQEIPVPKTAGAAVQIEDIFGNEMKGARTATSIFIRGLRSEIDRIIPELGK
ncbi:MAG: hypothetical protein JNM63_19105 [Spirochaetia bacterium]|nr:hypothetical protein [Spirochaetia bacterium]